MGDYWIKRGIFNGMFQFITRKYDKLIANISEYSEFEQSILWRIGHSNHIYSNYLPIRNAAYAPTKLVQHYYTKAISVEAPWLTAFPVDPG